MKTERSGPRSIWDSLKRIIPSSVKAWLWRYASQQLHLERQLSFGCRIKIQSFSDWSIYNDIFADGEYDVAIKYALGVAKGVSKITILDLGANVGFFTLRTMDLMTPAERARSHFVLVEPSRSLIGRLHATFGNRELQIPDVEVVFGLVGDRKGTGHFQIRHEQIHNAVTKKGSSSTRGIEYVDLEQIVGTDGNITLLKCDIEGSEKRFIANYSELLGRTQTAVFEFHEPECPPAEAFPKLAALGLISPRCLRDQGPNQTWCFTKDRTSSESDCSLGERLP